MAQVVTNKLFVDDKQPTMLYYMGEPMKKIVTVWDTAPDGVITGIVETTTANETVTLTTNSTVYSAYTVDWGDDSTPTAATYSHTYTDPNQYTITIKNTDDTIITTAKSYTFVSCAQLKEFTIPDTVTTIQTLFCNSCDGVEGCTIGTALTSVGSNAIRYCYNATWIRFNAISMSNISSGTVFLNAYGRDSDGVTVYIGENVQSIPNYLFYGTSDDNSYYTNIKKIVFVGSSQCTSIGQYAFCSSSSYTTKNESLTLPSRLETIGDGAFRNFYFNGTLTIPASVKIIGALSFANTRFTSLRLLCSELTNPKTSCFYSMSSVTSFYFDCGTVADFASDNSIFTYMGNTSGGFALTIGKHAKRIPAYFMLSSAKVTSLTFEEDSTCEAIGNNAFASNTYLAGGLTLPDSLLTLGQNAFNGCSNMTGTLDIGNGVTSLGTKCFSDNQFTTVIIGANVQSMSNYAFYRLNRVQHLYYNCEHDFSVGADNEIFTLLGNLSGAVTLHIGSNVTKIPANLFYSNTETTYVTRITSIAFEGTSSLTEIGENAFRLNIYLQSFAAPSTLTTIGQYAFQGCTALTTAILNDGLTTVNQYAFSTCSVLNTLRLPSTVQYIGSQAFRLTNGLTTLNYNCTALADFTSSINAFGYVGSTAKTCILNIAEGVTYLPTYVFGGNEQLWFLTINLPHSFTNFREGCLYAIQTALNIYYDGTITEWGTITKGTNWKRSNVVFTVHCTDGDVTA